jgi:hypothetical protein
MARPFSAVVASLRSAKISLGSTLMAIWTYRLVARYSERNWLYASDPNVMSLTIMLKSQFPACRSLPRNFQEKLIAILIGARAGQCSFNGNCGQLSNPLTPTFSRPIPAGISVGEPFLPPHNPHIHVWLQANDSEHGWTLKRLMA